MLQFAGTIIVLDSGRGCETDNDDYNISGWSRGLLVVNGMVSIVLVVKRMVSIVLMIT